MHRTVCKVLPFVLGVTLVGTASAFPPPAPKPRPTPAEKLEAALKALDAGKERFETAKSRATTKVLGAYNDLFKAVRTDPEFDMAD